MPDFASNVGWLEDAIKDGNINSFDYSQFSILKEIGRGGFGVVKSAQSEILERKVALKSLNTDDISKTFMKEFIREIKLLKDLHHPNINKLYGVTRGS
ncbi:7374_t:CDS:2 [Acaulospora morrowiae]|uniref:7374_t:CDS:1 n=1 Tax=Acaulospora morrowiae TaxID=94023 RepID=A0A9N9BCM9_9GLOM|nr:7374_t:CDS:2 [Acaulospora morrowiae]